MDDAVNGAPRAQTLRAAAPLGGVEPCARGRLPPHAVEARAQDETLTLSFPTGWLDAHPLTRADLDQEQAYLAAAGIGLRFA